MTLSRRGRVAAWAAMILAAGLATAASAETFIVDAVHSTVIFKVSHLNVSHFQGRINGPTGTVNFDAADPSKSSLEVSVKTANIDTANTKRDDDLKGPDFFNAKQFPTITFKSSSFKKLDENTFEVAGDLTLHGVTKPLTVKLTKVGEAQTQMGYRAGFETTFTIKRSDFGMKYLLSGVGDDVTLMVSLEGSKK